MGTEGVLGIGIRQGIACSVSARAIAQPVRNQETNCVGERKREREGGRLGLLCGWV